MKKGKILLAFVILEIIIFIIAMFTNVNGYALHNIWVNIALLFVGLYSLLYCVLFKLDSSLFYGFLLTTLALATAYCYINKISFTMFYPIYILCVCFAHFTVFAIFRQIIHFKLFAFLLIECILLIAFKSNLINWWWLVVLNGLYLFYLIINLFLRVKKNLRREK